MSLKRTLHFLSALAIASALSMSAAAQQAPAVDSSAPPLTNGGVITMVKRGVPESSILEAIRAGNNRFDVDVNSVMVLAQSGVSKRIISEMKSARGVEAPAGRTTAPKKAESPKTFCFAIWCR